MRRKVDFISSRNVVLALGASLALPPGLCLCTVKTAYVSRVSVLGMAAKALCVLGKLSVSQARTCT